MTPGEDRLVVPARPAERGRRRFGATWWGAAWLAALEGQATLDPNRLPRGRGYARRGAVGDAELRPGTVTAPVTGRRPEPYRVRLSVVRFTDPEWDRVLAAVAGRLGHTAALLDGELPPEVAEDVAGAGLSLLPGPRELTAWCSCPDRAVPCKHASAVCYLMADVIDADPFALLLLRGRGRDRVLTELRRRRGGTQRRSPAAAPPAPAGMPAAEAWRRDRPPLPRPLPPPSRPGTPPALPPTPGVPVAAVTALAEAAARRAHALLTGEDPESAQ